MKNKTAYLKCKIGQGIFKEENSVVFKNISGNKISGIFPESSIKNKRLEVIIVKEEGNKILIRTKYSRNNPGGYGFFSGSKIYVSKNLIN